MTRARSRIALLALLALACDRAPDVVTPPPDASDGRGLSPTARPEIVASLRRDGETARHAADGGGTATIRPLAVGTHVRAVVSRPARYEIVLEVGPLGIAVGGAIFLQAPPFWNWSTPQVEAPKRPGFTTVATTASGVELEARTIDRQLLMIEVGGRALSPGETIKMVYGAGDKGAIADRYAERDERFFVAVDGDGDGVRGLVASPLLVDVAPGPPARLLLTATSVVRPGAEGHLTIAVLDAAANAHPVVAGSIALTVAGSGNVELPRHIDLTVADRGVKTVPFTAETAGALTVHAKGPGRLEAESNPIVVAADLPRILWADLHGHSSLSDGTGTPDDFYRYARDVAALDVAALTDHDHWGMRPLATHPEMWEQIRAAATAHHDPGRFVTLLGYEWTSWLHGHRHVLYFTDEGRVYDSIDPAYESPPQLWAALRGAPALTFAHHSAGGPIATNWDFPPDPELEPVTEIASVHGSSEALDSPAVLYQPVPGNFVRDVLERGYRLGFIGSGDSHDGHPGLAHLVAASGGLAAILSDDSSRDGVLAALRARRTYATNGPRIILRVELAGQPMGSTLRAGETGAIDRAALHIEVVGTEAIDRIDLIAPGGIAATVPGEGRRGLDVTISARQIDTGEYLYVRVVQTDGGAAWSSPFFFD